MLGICAGLFPSCCQPRSAHCPRCPSPAMLPWPRASPERLVHPLAPPANPGTSVADFLAAVANEGNFQRCCFFFGVHPCRGPVQSMS